MKKKIHRYMTSVVFLTLFFALFTTGFIFYHMYQKQAMGELRYQAELLSEMFETASEISEHLQIQDTHTRLTVIRSNGEVLIDTAADSSQMEKHLNRKEIADAIKKGEGYDVRKSDTLQKVMYYYAVRLKDGNVLRISREEGSIWSIFYNAVYGIVFVAILMILVCMVCSHYLTNSLIRPIDRMARKIDHATELNPYEELVPFVQTIQKQHEEILRSADMRQEFTANVSHELKTPLTSISGYAELIQAGFTGEKETIRFAGEIKNNAQRLLTLINDIIRLSELDCQAEQLFENIELYELAEKNIQILQMSAKQHKVRLVLTGKQTTVYANKEMMEELIYNLCDNAIRYNKPGGTVEINVTGKNGYAALIVKDTGIGIPEESRERIFERFYRVDKSRSKATGGTGLGLAIVKHIILQHNAKIEVESEVGKGTSMKVYFTKQKTEG